MGLSILVGISADFSRVGSLGGRGWPTGLWLTSVRLPGVCVIPGSNRAFGERLGLQLPQGPPGTQGLARDGGGVYLGPPAGWDLWWLLPCSAAALTGPTHLCLLNVSRGGIGDTQLFGTETAGQRLGGRGWPTCGRCPGPWTPCTGLLCPRLTSTLSASLSWDAAARRGRIGTCSRGWGRRGPSRVPPGLHLCHLGLPEDRPLLQVPWSPAAGVPPRGAVCRLHLAASSLFPSLSGPERDAK